MNTEHFRLANYHSHTPRCLHATGSEEEYVRQAILHGYEEFGFADHSPWPYKSSFVAIMRMRLSELDSYVNAVNAVKRAYADSIRVYLGLECEAFPEFYPWLDEVKEEKGIDYLILGNHYDTSDEDERDYFGYSNTARQVRRYAETTIGGMETGRFVYLAHPDLFLLEYPRFDDEAKRACRAVCEAAKRLNMPLEYNILGEKRNASDRARGGLGYNTREFWEIAAETGNRAIIGVDAHKPEQLDCVNSYREARTKLKNAGIEVLETLDQI